MKCVPLLISVEKYTTTETSYTTACPLVDLMNGEVALSRDSISTSSNAADKENLIGGTLPWESSSNDTTPTINVTLSPSQNVTVTDVKLVDPVNVATYKVIITDTEGNQVFQTVKSRFFKIFQYIRMKEYV